MKEWNAIDLHMHTLTGVTGDAKKDEVKNFSYANFLNAIIKNDLKLISITNHNIINMKNYIMCRFLTKIIKTNLLLGVEIDTENSENKNYHIVFIFDENLYNSVKVSDKINELTNNKKSLGKIRYSAEEIVSLIKEYNLIIIPHGDKSKGLLQRPNQTELIDALKKVKEGFIRVFDNPSDWKLAQIKKVIKEDKLFESVDSFGGVLFSDNRDWLNYDLKYKDFYMHAEPTFKGFLHAITNPTQRFSTKEFIKMNSNYISEIQILDDNTNGSRLKPCSIKLLNGYNCIIGKSGSGKSLLLNIIDKKLRNKNTNKYTFVNENQIKIFNEVGNELNVNNVNVGVGESIFDKIISASDSNDSTNMYKVIELLKKDFVKNSKLKAFVEKYKNVIRDYVSKKNIIESKDECISEFILFQSSELELKKLKDIKPFTIQVPNLVKVEYSDEDLKKIKSFTTKIKELKDIINLLKPEDSKILDDKVDNLEKAFDITLQGIMNRISKQNYINKKISIIKNAIIKVNSNISDNSKRKKELLDSVPEKIANLVSFVKNRYITKIQLSTFNLSIKIEDINNLVTIDEDEKISFTETIPENIIKEVDIKNNLLFYTYGFKQQITSKIYDMTNKNEAKEVIDKYYKLKMINDDFLKKMFDEIKLEINVYFDNQNVKELNPGDIAKKYIQYYFKHQLTNNSNTIILYDQIENDVDKAFISSTIIDLINDMQTKAQVIIVTHDPIVAVNADPINYIEAIKGKDNKIIYRSFVPESSIRDELETIAINVDGSKKVIKDRYEIYKGEANYED